MEEIINDIKQNIADKLMWAYPIANKLQECHYSLAIRWAVECIEIFTPEYEPHNLPKIDKYLQQIVEELNQNTLNSLDCYEIYMKIWYSPEREDAQTAVTLLWWSIANFKDGNESSGARDAGAAVEVILPDITNSPLLDKYLEVAQRIYQEHQFKTPTS